MYCGRWFNVPHVRNPYLSPITLIESYLLALYKSNLSDRKQCTVVDGSKSHMLEIQAGASQDSRLGSLLFIIFINDIFVEILIFADDCSILARYIV